MKLLTRTRIFDNNILGYGKNCYSLPGLEFPIVVSEDFDSMKSVMWPRIIRLIRRKVREIGI